jgi:dTDP-4-dehydrorhamnose reductase
LKIVITGCKGQVGWELKRALAPLGEITALDHAGLDLADPEGIRAKIRALHPDVIVNAAAYTAVDHAESESDLAHAINARAPGVLGEEAARCGALLVHYSTDYVFDGSKSTPYIEDDVPNPISAYGRSKLEGERAVQASGCRHIILRTTWIYAARGKNFLLTILRLAAERPELRVVNDQYGAPTSAPSIADATATIIRSVAGGNDATGVFHLTAAGRTTWHEFATLIVASMPPPHPAVLAIPSSEFPTAARRPANSCLDNGRLSATFGIRLRDWREEAQRILSQLHAPAAVDRQGS